MIKQKKLVTFHTPYQTLNQILWKKKKVVERSNSLNKILKSKINQANSPLNGKLIAKISCDQHPDKMIKDKFCKLNKMVDEQNKWIKETNKQIEEKSYQELKREILFLEENLKKVTMKTKRMIKMVKNDQKKNNYEQCQQISAPNQSFFQRVSKQNKELLLFYEYKSKNLEQSKVNITKLNRQILQLLLQKQKIKKKTLNTSQTPIKSRKSEHIKPNTAQMSHKLTQSLRFKSKVKELKLKIG